MAEARTAAGRATTFAEKSAIKDKLKDAYAISKFATGSMGKFDAKVADEPKVKAKGKAKKRGQVTGNMAGEKAKQLAMLSKLNSGPTTIRTASGLTMADAEAPVQFDAGNKGGKKGRKRAKIQTRFAPKGPSKKQKKGGDFA